MISGVCNIPGECVLMLHGMLGLHTEACTEANTRTILYGHLTPGPATRVRASRPPSTPDVPDSASGSARHVVFSSIRELNLIRRPQGSRKFPYKPLNTASHEGRAALLSRLFCACGMKCNRSIGEQCLPLGSRLLARLALARLRSTARGRTFIRAAMSSGIVLTDCPCEDWPKR